MAFKDTKVIWKLKDNIDMPYACKDDSANTQVTASVQPNIVSDVEQSDTKIQAQVLSASNTASNNEVIAVVENTSDSVKTSSDTNNTNTAQSESLCVVPTDNLNMMSNVATTAPVINGQSVNLNVDSSRLPKWRSLPYRLRQKRADIYINKNASVDFTQSLCDYLIKRGLNVLEYDDSVHYLPSDVLLLDKTDLVDAGIVICLQLGKREVYNQLKAEFGDRV